MAELKITNLCKKYEDTFEAVRDFNLEARDGEFIVIVGPSGCGKSTTLRMIAGLEQPSAGSILLDGMAIDHLPPQKRDMAMIFQNYALYENMTAFDNIAFPLTEKDGDRIKSYRGGGNTENIRTVKSKTGCAFRRREAESGNGTGHRPGAEAVSDG